MSETLTSDASERELSARERVTDARGRHWSDIDGRHRAPQGRRVGCTG